MNNENEKIITKKYLYILLSVLVAICIWIFVDELNGGVGTLEFKNIPITYRDTNDVLSERGLMLVLGEDNGTSETVDLELKGRRSLIAGLDDSMITVTADLSGITRTGKQTVGYTISYSDRKYNDATISVEDASFRRASVHISELNKRIIDVRCELIGNVADGYSAGEVQLSNTEMELRGQAKDIDRISYAKVTFDIGEDAAETITKELTYQFYDRNDNIIEGKGVHASVERVQAKLPVFVTKELPLVVNYVEAPGARLSNTERSLTPATITVSGDASLLKHVTSIVLGDIDLLELTDASTAYEASYPIIIPDGCQNLSGVTRATLKIRFKDMGSTQLLATNFDYANLPEGKTATILTEELPVTFFGMMEDVDAMTSEDFVVIADLSDYSGASGTYTVPAVIQVDSGLDVGVSGTYQVQARILEREPDDTPPEEP